MVDYRKCVNTFLAYIECSGKPGEFSCGSFSNDKVIKITLKFKKHYTGCYEYHYENSTMNLFDRKYKTNHEEGGIMPSDYLAGLFCHKGISFKEVNTE